jgi:hypothetical protein
LAKRFVIELITGLLTTDRPHTALTHKDFWNKCAWDLRVYTGSHRVYFTSLGVLYCFARIAILFTFFIKTAS